jgi:putative membrane protein
MYGWGSGWHPFGWGLLFWWVLGILLLVAVILWIGRLAGRSGSGSAGAGREDTPETTLKRRYARGEISREQYQQMLEDIRR